MTSFRYPFCSWMSDPLLPESKAGVHVGHFRELISMLGLLNGCPCRLKKKCFLCPLLGHGASASTLLHSSPSLLLVRVPHGDNYDYCKPTCIWSSVDAFWSSAELFCISWIFSNLFGVGFTKSRSAYCRCIDGRPLFLCLLRTLPTFDKCVLATGRLVIESPVFNIPELCLQDY